MRILIYTGKGGVGKTSISAATAYHLSKLGKRVLLISTDQAHSLEDSFACPLSDGISPVTENLSALQINPMLESKRAWGNLQDYLKQIISQKANGGIEAEEALLFPGFDELFSLLRILEIYETKEYDILIVDCAPTGESLSMLSYSEKLTVLADSILPMLQNVTSVFGNFLSKKTSVPKPRDAVFEELKILIKRLNTLQTILHNREITSIRIVTTLEHIVLEEAKRNNALLHLYDFSVDAVYFNKLYPEEALKGSFSSWKTIQEEQKKSAKKIFSHQKHFFLDLQKTEIRGFSSLEKIGKILYQETDPSDIFFKTDLFSIEEIQGTRIFILPLPSIRIEELRVEKEEKDLVLYYRNEIRRFHLPDKLANRHISSYEYQDEKLRIAMDYE